MSTRRDFIKHLSLVASLGAVASLGLGVNAPPGFVLRWATVGTCQMSMARKSGYFWPSLLRRRSGMIGPQQ